MQQTHLHQPNTEVERNAINHDTAALSPVLAKQRLAALDARSELYASQFVELLLEAAQALGATDIHLCPSEHGLEISLRVEGVLQSWGVFPAGAQSDIVTRLKVMADLLTYRTDVPQEGRIRNLSSKGEIRVSSFPTLHGEKIAVRMFAPESSYQYLEDLGLPSDVQELLQRKLFETSGAILITGPAGSGKTTTAYACLRELIRISGGGRSIATLEDPIEVSVAGVAQSQVRPESDFDLPAGLRSLLRQDPEVIFIGEMRDPLTAATALQASLTGQLVLTTFHAGSAVGAVNRLLDMGLEPYMLRTGILAVVCQRLVRKLCSCSIESDDPKDQLGLPVSKSRTAKGCPACHNTGYKGRMLLIESLTLEAAQVASAILERWDATRLERAAIAAGMRTRWDQAILAVEGGLTSAAEVRRVLGFSDAFSVDR